MSFKNIEIYYLSTMFGNYYELVDAYKKCFKLKNLSDTHKKLIGIILVLSDNINDISILEQIYSTFSSSHNPMGTKYGQLLLKRLHVRHTTMSIGDIIRIDNNFYLVDFEDFQKLPLLSNPITT